MKYEDGWYSEKEPKLKLWDSMIFKTQNKVIQCCETTFAICFVIAGVASFFLVLHALFRSPVFVGLFQNKNPAAATVDLSFGKLSIVAFAMFPNSAIPDFSWIKNSIFESIEFSYVSESNKNELLAKFGV